MNRALAPLVVGLLATALSLVAIGVPSFWGDEVATIMSATRSWPDLWAMLGHVDAVHGAYYAFMHVWIDWFGAGPVSIRVPSAIGVGIAAAGVVTLVRSFKPALVAVLAGLVFAILPKVHDLGGEARPYAITMAFAAWILVVGRIAAKGNTAWRWVGYAVLLAVGTVWFVYLPLLALAQLALIFVGHPDSRRGLIAAVIGAAIAVSPFAIVAFGQRGQLNWIANAGVNGPQQVLVEAWFGWWPLALVGWALIVGIVVVTIRRKILDPLVFLDAATALVPLAILWIASLFAPVFSPRYLAMCLPSVAVLIALALAELWTWRRVAGAIAVLLVVGLSVPVLVAQRGPYAKHDSDWAELAAAVESNARQGDAIVFDESGAPWFRPRLAMHGCPSEFAAVVDPTGRGLTVEDVWDTNVIALANANLTGINRVWLVEHAGQPDESDRATLAALGFSAGATERIRSTQITLFTRG